MMGEFIPIFIVTLGLLLVLAVGLAFGRSPTYRPERTEVRELIAGVLNKTTRVEAWDTFVGLPIVHDTELEAIRRRCLRIHEGDDQQRAAKTGIGSAIYDREGRERLVEVLDELDRLIRETPVYREF